MGQDRKETEGQQPEAEASLRAAARAGSRKPDHQGLEATGETAPEPGSLEAEQREAAELLNAGARAADKD